MKKNKITAFDCMSNPRGIGSGDLLIFISLIFVALVFFVPDLLKEKTDPLVISQAEADLVLISAAIQRLEKHSGILVGYPGPNPCVNDPEFDNLNHCRLGIMCNDGKYPLWAGPYLKEIPKDPWGREYYLDNDYHNQGIVSRVLGSKGPNGVQDYGQSSDDVILVLCSDKKNGGV